MKRFLWVALSLTLVLATACQGASQPATDASSASATDQAPSGDSIGDAYRLILQRSVEPVDAATVATAGVNGLRSALVADGVTPPDVPVPTFTQDANQDLVLLHSSVQNVANRYSSKLNPGQVVDAVIDGMAKSVGDCHTVYFTSRQFSLQIASMQGQMQFGGIGASLRKGKPSEPLVIWRVFTGSPADRAGLRDGDVIQAVDGTDITSFSVQTVVDLIRGPVGKPVQLTVMPAGRQESQSITITRGQIQPPSVEYRMLPNQVGYVQLYGFPENVAGQLKGALDALDRQGARAVVLDVRDNGGGLLDSVTQVLSIFSPKGTLLFYSYDSSGKRTDYVADGSARSRQLPAVVLSNDGTGSGGEIFAAVLREKSGAQIIGQKTAGCVGTGQLFSLPDGGGIQVAVAQLLTGQGKVLNQVGVAPDVSIEMSVQDLVAGRDPQLDRALQLLQTGK